MSAPARRRAVTRTSCAALFVGAIDASSLRWGPPDGIRHPAHGGSRGPAGRESSLPTTFLAAAETAAVRHVVESCASRPANTDTVFDLLDELQGLIGCDLVAFNLHDTPERRLHHAQAVASGERQLASPQELAPPPDDEPFWRSYWSCEPCSLPGRVEAPVVTTISAFYGPHLIGNGPQAPRARLRTTRRPEPYRGAAGGRTGGASVVGHAARPGSWHLTLPGPTGCDGEVATPEAGPRSGRR